MDFWIAKEVTVLNRDQWNAQEYLASGLLLYEAFSAPEERDLRDALFALDGAVASFGRAEMLDRQVARDTAIAARGRDPARGDAFGHYQSAGLRALTEASSSIRQFRTLAEQQERANVDAPELQQRLRAFDYALRVELATLELKPVDVERLAAQLDETIAVASAGDPFQILDHVTRKIDELIDVRSGDDPAWSTTSPGGRSLP